MLRGRSLTQPAFAFVLLAIVALTAGALGYATEGSPRRAALPAEAQPNEVRGVVQAATADSLTLTIGAGPVTLKLTTGTPIEALRPAASAAVRTGDWLNLGAVGNSQTVFALTGIVLIRQEDLQPR